MQPKELLDELVRVSDLLYQNNLKEGVQELPKLVQQLAGFAPNLREEDVAGYTAVLRDIMGAMELKDYILLADLLIYEVTPIIETYGN